jgi:hypothetical protein
MIKTVVGNRYIMVEGGSPAGTYLNHTSSPLGAGNVRWNANFQWFEVYDGISWTSVVQGHTSVSLTPEAANILDWAKKKMHEETELARLAEHNPTIAGLIEQKKNLDDKIKMVQILVREEPKFGTN